LIPQPTVQRYDVEAHNEIPEVPVTCDKNGSGGDEFSPLASINRLRGRGEASRLNRFAIPDFDKHETPGILHDQVNFTDAAAEVPGDEIESACLQVGECPGLRVLSY
jgi:hypothetical protein